jgi:hypothetical protein
MSAYSEQRYFGDITSPQLILLEKRISLTWIALSDEILEDFLSRIGIV